MDFCSAYADAHEFLYCFVHPSCQSGARHLFERYKATPSSGVNFVQCSIVFCNCRWNGRAEPLLKAAHRLCLRHRLRLLGASTLRKRRMPRKAFHVVALYELDMDMGVQLV